MQLLYIASNKYHLMKYISLILLVLFFNACETDDPVQIPLCIDQEIAVFAQTACPSTGDLTIWFFDGQDVFCFNEGSCYADATAYIYDANCNLVCTLGGSTNNTLCQGLEWDTNAVYLELVYVF